MLLEDNYYLMYSRQYDAKTAHFHFKYLADCDVYRGHFPGNPVCPAACNIETLKECLLYIFGPDWDVRISFIKQCRFTAIASPTTCPEMDLYIAIECPSETLRMITAKLMDENEKLYMEFKGEVILSSKS